MEMANTDQSPINRLLKLMEEGRLPELMGDSLPWESDLQEAIKAVRDHLEEKLHTSIWDVKDSLKSVIDRQIAEASNRGAAQIGPTVRLVVQEALKPIREEVEALKRLIETIPQSIRVAVESVPSVIVQTPRRRVTKTIDYDEMGKPVKVNEHEIFDRSDVHNP